MTEYVPQSFRQQSAGAQFLIAGGERGWVSGMAASLCRLGYRVATADTGVECIAKIRADRPEAVILGDGLLWGGSEGVIEVVGEEYAHDGRPSVLLIGGSPRRVETLPRWVRHVSSPTVGAVLSAFSEFTPREDLTGHDVLANCP